MTLADHVLAIVDRHTGVELTEIAYQLDRRRVLATPDEILQAVDELVDAGVLEPRAGCVSSVYYSRIRKAALT